MRVLYKRLIANICYLTHLKYIPRRACDSSHKACNTNRNVFSREDLGLSSLLCKKKKSPHPLDKKWRRNHDNMLFATSLMQQGPGREHS